MLAATAGSGSQRVRRSRRRALGRRRFRVRVNAAMTHPVPASRLDEPRSAATIGVYGFDIETFLASLAAVQVVTVFDVRQRRGVRGPQYAWANSRRLQGALAGAGLAYEHHPELAPTTELRLLQYDEDARQGVGKRSRLELAPEYARRYVEEILDQVDLDPIVATMPTHGTTALLCVEADPEACHRSLIAVRLADEYNATVTHLRPNGQAR